MQAMPRGFLNEMDSLTFGVGEGGALSAKPDLTRLCAGDPGLLISTIFLHASCLQAMAHTNVLWGALSAAALGSHPPPSLPQQPLSQPGTAHQQQ